MSAACPPLGGRSLCAVVAVVLAVMLGAVCDARAASRAERVEALYVQNASRGTFDGRRLKLHGVAPVVSWFADRPQRSSGILTMRRFVGDLFGHGPVLNAALDFARNEVSGVLALTLRAPRWDARRRVLSYRVRRLRTLRETKVAHLDSERRRARIPRRFGGASLFIDDGQAPEPSQLETFTDANFELAVIVRSSDQPVVVAVGAPWCGPCRTYLPIVNRVATDRSGTIVVGTLNTDDYPTLAESYDVESIPITLVFRNGQVVDKWADVMSSAAIEQRLDALDGA
jgi:thiol-disulfide isomerase/thioredoxin